MRMAQVIEGLGSVALRPAPIWFPGQLGTAIGDRPAMRSARELQHAVGEDQDADIAEVADAIEVGDELRCGVNRRKYGRAARKKCCGERDLLSKRVLAAGADLRNASDRIDGVMHQALAASAVGDDGVRVDVGQVLRRALNSEI